MHELLSTVDKERNSARTNMRQREREREISVGGGERSEMSNTYRGVRTGIDTVFL